MHVPISSEKLPRTVDPGWYGDPQVLKVQRIRGHGILGSKWDIYNTSPPSKAQGSPWKKSKKIVRTRGDG